jgi:hypothetical protein
MKLFRPVVCLAAAASLAAAGTAVAATKPKPKPVCKLVTDAAGDASLSTAAPIPPNEPGLDITSADIAANAKVLTAVFRLASLETPSTAPFGYSAVMYFNVPTSDNALYFRYGNSPLTGPVAEFGWDNPAADGGLTPLGDAAVVVDQAKKEVRMSAPLKGFVDQATIKLGTKITGLTVNTSRDLVALLVYADLAESAKSYVVGQPSCVVPGK